MQTAEVVTARERLAAPLARARDELLHPDFDPSKLKLDGKKLDARIEQSVTGGELERTIEGASTLTLTLSDDHRALLRSGIFLTEDEKLAPLLLGLPGPKRKIVFSLAQITKTGDELTLTFEDREIARLRTFNKSRKANRENTTRAEFIGLLAREAGIRYKSPELHKVQPIGRHKKASSKTTGSDAKAGIPRDAHLTVKGNRASPEQIRNMEQANDVAERLDCSRKVRVALNAACIVESEFHNLSGGEGSSVGILQLTAGKPDRRNITSVVTRFLQDGFTGAGGAINLDKRHPGWSPGQIAQACQGSAFPSRYDQYAREAERIVDAYAGDTGSAGSSTTRTVVKPYYFTRGVGGKREDSWTAIKRLSEEVGWRAYMIEGVLYYATEEELFRAKPKMRISEDSPGVDWIDFDWDTGKLVGQATVRCRVDAWMADPGSVIELKESGPANGLWLVESLRRGLYDAAAEITLRKPMQEKPEPAPETETSTETTEGEASTSTAASGPKAKALRLYAVCQAISEAGGPYSYGGGHGPPLSQLRGGQGLDCSSATSLALWRAGLLDERVALVSDAFARTYGRSGRGKFFTVWANGGHVFIEFHGLGRFKRFDTSPHGSGGPGPRMRLTSRSTGGFTARHAGGL